VFNRQHFLVIRLPVLHITKNIQSDTESADLQVKKCMQLQEQET